MCIVQIQSARDWAAFVAIAPRCPFGGFKSVSVEGLTGAELGPDLSCLLVTQHAKLYAITEFGNITLKPLSNLRSLCLSDCATLSEPHLEYLSKIPELYFKRCNLPED